MTTFNRHPFHYFGLPLRNPVPGYHPLTVTEMRPAPSSSSSSTLLRQELTGNRSKWIPSQKKISTCHREIEHHKMCGKSIAKNRYAYDARYDCPSTWPNWPTNVFFTATTTPEENFRNRSSSICSTSSSSANIAPSFVEYLSDRSDEDDSRDDADEPERKRLRVSPVSSSLLSSEPEDAFTEFDCELLSQFFDFDSEQLF